MTAHIIDGKAVARMLRGEYKAGEHDLWQAGER